MKTENINHDFLDGVLTGEHVDNYHHLGVSSDDAVLERMRGIRAIIMAGSGERIDTFARQWSAENDNAEIDVFPKDERFVTRYCAGVLFVSHGMGMPSASIAIQELMRMVFFLKGGDLEALDEIFWARVGTSGGVGLPGGTIVVTTESIMADLKPYRLLDGGQGIHWFDGTYPQDVVDAIVAASEGTGIPITPGRTVATDEFFLEQFRLDGAIRLASPDRKMEWLRWLDENGVRNIEMEGAMLAAYMNTWGFSRFAMICTTLLNRLEGDQITSSAEQLHEYTDRAGAVMFAYLRTLG